MDLKFFLIVFVIFGCFQFNSGMKQIEKNERDQGIVDCVVGVTIGFVSSLSIGIGPWVASVVHTILFALLFG